MDKKTKTSIVIEKLEEKYGFPKTALLYENPFQLLIAVILSAQCTDARVNIVTKELFKQLKDPQAFVDAPLLLIEKLVFSTGFYKNKAFNIQGCCKMLVEKHNSIVPKTMEEMVLLPGVGRKTANVVLGDLYNIAEGVVVDTHIFRVTKRLGISKGKTPEPVEKDLMKILKKEDWIKYSNLLIWHGRDICHSRKPKCDICPFNNICNYYKD